jgi:hypothetical protein
MNSKHKILNAKQIFTARLYNQPAQKFLTILGLLAAVFIGQTLMAKAAVFIGDTTVRPIQVKAKVEGCQIAKPGDYEVKVGDLIELNYTYPVVPAAMPNKVFYKQTIIGAIAISPLGFRRVIVPEMIGTVTIAFYFEAKKEGEETVALIIDDAEYVYKFKVVKK